MRREDEMSIQEAAAYLGRHENTVRRWAREAVSRGGKYNGICVRRDVTGHYWIKGEGIREKANG